MKKFILMLCFLLFPQISFADESEDKNTIVYKKTTEIDFDSLNIDAEIVKPQGSFILERRQAAFNPLIQLRINWNEEIAQSTDVVK